MKTKSSLTGKRKREDEDEMEGEEIFQAAADHPLFWSDPTIFSRVCPWLTLLEFGRVEQICRGSTIHDDRWQELIERYYRPGKVPAIRNRFVDRFGGYRGLMRYEVLFVRKKRPSESFVNVPGLLPLNFPRREAPSTSPHDVITTIEVNAFGKRKILSLRNFFAQTTSIKLCHNFVPFSLSIRKSKALSSLKFKWMTFLGQSRSCEPRRRRQSRV